MSREGGRLRRPPLVIKKGVSLVDTLNKVKEYLRIDADDDSQDREISELIDGAILYIQRTSRKKFKEGDPLMLQALKLLVSQWFTNRQIEGKTSNFGEYAHSFSAILCNIALCDDYEPYKGEP